MGGRGVMGGKGGDGDRGVMGSMGARGEMGGEGGRGGGGRSWGVLEREGRNGVSKVLKECLKWERGEQSL